MTPRVILLHVQAPAKPDVGERCNGCGLCCAAEPCPLGMLLSRRRSGACAALRWSDAQGRYHCGLVAAPPRGLPSAWATRLVLRWIGAGRGCDCTLQRG